MELQKQVYYHNGLDRLISKEPILREQFFVRFQNYRNRTIYFKVIWKFFGNKYIRKDQARKLLHFWEISEFIRLNQNGAVLAGVWR